MCFENQTLGLKEKYSIFSALEQMLILYNYQQADIQVYLNNIRSMLGKIS